MYTIESKDNFEKKLMLTTVVRSFDTFVFIATAPSDNT